MYLYTYEKSTPDYSCVDYSQLLGAESWISSTLNLTQKNHVFHMKFSLVYPCLWEMLCNKIILFIYLTLLGFYMD